jgi:hypothetical protein
MVVPIFNIQIVNPCFKVLISLLYRNFSLGLVTKARGCKVAGQKGDRESHHMLPGVQRVWGNEPSHSPLNSHCGSRSTKWTLEPSERNCRGQNPLVGKVFYIIGKLLKLRWLKWACIAHLDIWNTSYDQKKGRESNWQFDSRPLKVGNQPDFLIWRWRATYCWKALDKDYNFTLDLITIRGLHAKLWAPKVAGVRTMGISRLPSPDVAPVERCKVYYKGEGGGFPKSGPWWVLWV